MAKLLGLFRPINWPSWTILAWRAVDTWGNIEFLRGKMDAVITFIKSPLAIILALIWLFMVALGWHTKLLALFHRKRVSATAMEDSGHTETFANLPYLFRSEINYVHFGWLWKDDPYLVFGMQVWNASPYDIELVGVKGSANINDTSCTREAEKAVPSNIPSYKKGSNSYSADFYQPITQKHAETLQSKLQGGQPIPFDLSPVEWVGTLALPTGKIPLPPRLICARQFEVDGARITPEHSQANVQRGRLA